MWPITGLPRQKERAGGVLEVRGMDELFAPHLHASSSTRAHSALGKRAPSPGENLWRPEWRKE